MVWTLLHEAAPLIVVKITGVIEWNAASNEMMDSPVSVKMYYDVEENRLGFRGVHRCTCLKVQYSEDLTFRINASEHLEYAGLSFEHDWDATPQLSDIVDPPELCGIVWIAIPE